MKPTVTSHEIIDQSESRVHRWRVSRLKSLGICEPWAEIYAGQLDWHQVAQLVRRGCPPWLALRIAG